MGLLTAETRRDTALAWMFVLVQFALLAAVALLPSGTAWSVPRWVDRAGQAVQLLGALALVVGAVGLGRSLTALPTPIDHGVLRVSGPYRWVRHPIYSGVMALALGTAVRSASVAVLIASLALVGWLAVKARWEEGHLRRRYPGYGAYAARTPRYVPFWPGR